MQWKTIQTHPSCIYSHQTGSVALSCILYLHCGLQGNQSMPKKNFQYIQTHVIMNFNLIYLMGF